MAPSESTNVFVSYSHADASLVSPVVKLLRVNKSLVFQDIDGIQPGKRWQGEIANALSESHLVVVFWCTHASQSNQVSKEWQAAIEEKKDLLPLLLDTTPLPPQLAEFQWIDFRGTVGANHSSIDSMVAAAAPSTVPLKPARRLLISAVVTVFAIASACLGWFISLKSASHPKSFYPMRTPAPTPPIYAQTEARLDLGLGTLLLIGIAFAITAWLIWLLRKRRKGVIPIETPARPPRGIERHIASELEAEILRRTTLRRGQGS